VKLKILPRLGRNKPETLNKDSCHLVEATGIEIWELDLGMTLYVPLEEHGLSKRKQILVGFSLDFLPP
jgi:hypothetical protein